MKTLEEWQQHEQHICHDWRSHPIGRVIWIPIAISDLFFRGLALCIYYLFRARRQDKHWTWRQAIRCELLRVGFLHLTYIKCTRSVLMGPGSEDDRFWVMSPPCDPTTGSISSIYRGVLDDETIKPVIVGGTWYPSLPSAKALLQDRITLHFHGGAFLWGSGRDTDSKFSGEALASYLGGRALLVQYRLASSTSSFPAAFQDALTAYSRLIQARVPPENITISGDSAGGLLALGLLRYLTSTQVLPLPRACLLFSPSVDMVFQGHAKAIDTHRNARFDLLNGKTLAWGVAEFLPTQSRNTPYLAPARYPFETRTPIWVQCGSNEVLVDTIRMFVEGMQEVPGNVVELYDVPFAPHDILFIGHLIGWEHEALAAVANAKAFVDKVSSVDSIVIGFCPSPTKTDNDSPV